MLLQLLVEALGGIAALLTALLVLSLGVQVEESVQPLLLFGQHEVVMLALQLVRVEHLFPFELVLVDDHWDVSLLGVGPPGVVSPFVGRERTHLPVDFGASAYTSPGEMRRLFAQLHEVFLFLLNVGIVELKKVLSALLLVSGETAQFVDHLADVGLVGIVELSQVLVG